jgi:mannose-6-phosphate isomerase-like protein (cupin superfamily)
MYPPYDHVVPDFSRASMTGAKEMNIRNTRGRTGFIVGLIAGTGLTAGAFAWARTASAQEGGASKYDVKIVLENDRVRVRDVTFPPGVLDTGMHTHAYAHVGVILTEGTLLFTDPAGKTERVEFRSGSVGFRDANATHQVANPGAAPMRVIEVELKQ